MPRTCYDCRYRTASGWCLEYDGPSTHDARDAERGCPDFSLDPWMDMTQAERIEADRYDRDADRLWVAS